MHISLLKSLCNAREITQEKIGIVLVLVLSRFMRKNCDERSPSICRAIGTEEVRTYIQTHRQAKRNLKRVTGRDRNIGEKNTVK